jgi:hypothetical protein
MAETYQDYPSGGVPLRERGKQLENLATSKASDWEQVALGRILKDFRKKHAGRKDLGSLVRDKAPVESLKIRVSAQEAGRLLDRQKRVWEGLNTAEQADLRRIARCAIVALSKKFSKQQYAKWNEEPLRNKAIDISSEISIEDRESIAEIFGVAPYFSYELMQIAGQIEFAENSNPMRGETKFFPSENCVSQGRLGSDISED